MKIPAANPPNPDGPSNLKCEFMKFSASDVSLAFGRLASVIFPT
jgi:hypothetical protein